MRLKNSSPLMLKIEHSDIAVTSHISLWLLSNLFKCFREHCKTLASSFCVIPRSLIRSLISSVNRLEENPVFKYIDEYLLHRHKGQEDTYWMRLLYHLFISNKR